MSQVVQILVAAGGILVAAAIIGAVGGAFKLARAVRDNTTIVASLSTDLTNYMHSNDTEKAVMQKDIQNLKDWRLQVESSNRAAAFGGGTSSP